MSEPAMHPDVERVVRSTFVLSPSSYSIEGQLRDLSRQNVKISVPPGLPDWLPVVVPFMENEIYGRLYTRSRQMLPAPATISDLRDHIAALSAANCGSGSWESGWLIEAVEENGMALVMRDGITFRVPRGEVRTRKRRLQRGEPCQVRVEKEMRQLVPGFYVAIGNGDPKERREAARPQIRFYWHLTPAGAVEYMRAITRNLNDAAIPFRTKVVADPNGYVRADAGVLYIDKNRFAQARPLIAKTYGEVRGVLRPETPLFTKTLAPGLGFAEDPRGGLSFGYSRSRLLARALWHAHQPGGGDPEGRISAVRDFFRSEGIDPSAPFLESGSFDVYALAAGEKALAAGEKEGVR